MKTRYDNVFLNPTFDELPMSVRDNTPIAFDMDSVLNEGDYLRHYIANHFGTTMDAIILKDPSGYECFNFKVPGVSEREIVDVIDRCILEESPSALPTPFLADVLKWVHEITGRPIAVVTQRNWITSAVTHDWLEEHLDGIPFYAYIINGSSKNDTLHMLGVDIFIDDRWKTIGNLISRIKYPVLYNRPWNIGRPLDLEVLRVRDLRDIIPLLNIELGRVPMDWPWYVPYPRPQGERITKRYATVR